MVPALRGGTRHKSLRFAAYHPDFPNRTAYLRPLRECGIVVDGASMPSYGRGIVLSNLGMDLVLP
jgi:hypothetical protein